MNNNSSSSSELGQAEEKTTIDRLSHLPDAVLHYILSFLDTKSAVQTSVLSRAWMCVWKHVPVLNIKSDSFQDCPSFRRYVDKVLSLRSDLNVDKISYIKDGEFFHKDDRDDSMCVKEVIKYALSHDTRHLVINLDNSKVKVIVDGYRLSCLFGSILSCNLKSLELRAVALDGGFPSHCFRVLTTLCLKWCMLVPGEEEKDLDPFSNFPCLEKLVLDRCVLYGDQSFGGERRIIKISGAQLLSLKLKTVFFPKIEIFAPRVRFLSFRNVLAIHEFSKFSLPSLVDAFIVLKGEGDIDGEDDNEWVTERLLSLFRGLKNATSLGLDSYSIEVLSRVFELLEQQPSPFTRLESFILRADMIPYELVNYFLKGSSSMKPNVYFV